MTGTPRLGIVGVGAVGRTLALAFGRAGVPVRVAHARPAAAPSVDSDLTWAPSAQACVDTADLVLLTVPDDAIAPVCEALRWRAGTAVVHCSGATELTALAAARQAGAQVGGFHPLQMFANPAVALAGLPGCFVGIEADERLAPLLASLAQQIGLTPLPLPPGARARYHASAYYVGPFAIALLQEAAAIWASFGATEAQALAALAPLLRGTLAAALDRGLAGGMGGCVARGDVGTVKAHLAALAPLDDEVLDLYRTLARRTIPLAVARGTLGGAAATAIAAALAPPPAGPEPTVTGPGA